MLLAQTCLNREGVQSTISNVFKQTQKASAVVKNVSCIFRVNGPAIDDKVVMKKKKFKRLSAKQKDYRSSLSQQISRMMTDTSVYLLHIG